MSSISISGNRLLRFGAAGAVSGLIAFAIIEPMAGRATGGGEAAGLEKSAQIFAIVSLFIALGLVLAEEISSLQPLRIIVRSLKALIVGAVGGFIAGLLGQLIYRIIGLISVWTLGSVGDVFARTAGWALVGAIIGAAIGVASGSPKRSLLGFVGGLIGGGLGGIVFDMVGAVSNDSASRMVGITSVGVATGLAIALVEEMAKRAWIIVLAGRNEGKEYILDKAQTRIGRDELADIPLFGDLNVAKLHGMVEATGAGYYFRDAAGGCLVNNQPAGVAPLSDGDVIRIGRFSLSFRTKGAPRSIGKPPASPTALSKQEPPVAPVQTVMPGLRVVAGPYAGQRFNILSQNIGIGREPGNIIVLEQDGGVSRRHAQISYENGRYVVRDLGSTNGTLVNGIRVTEATLAAGDTIQVGATSLTLVFE